MADETKTDDTTQGTPAAEDASTGTAGGSEGTNEPETKKLNVLGTERVYTQQQIEDAANRHFAGENKLAEAQQLKESILAEAGTIKEQAELGDAVTKMVRDNDPTQFQFLLKKLTDYNEAEIEEVSQIVMANNSNTGTPAAGQQSGTLNAADERLAALEAKIEERDKVIDDLQSRQERDDQQYLAGYEQQLHQAVDQTVDTDEVLGNVVKEAGPRAKALKDHAWKLMQGRIAQAHARNETLGPQVFSEVVAEVRALWDGLDIPKAGPASIPGLAPMPGVLDDFHPEQKPRDVAVTDKDWKKSIREALVYKAREHAAVPTD